jgi:two-component sensor histidine kinase
VEVFRGAIESKFKASQANPEGFGLQLLQRMVEVEAQERF